YKACTLELDGLEDKTEWYLPSEGELITIAKYKTEINELLSSVSGNQNIITTDWYWSSTEYDASSAWYVPMGYGNVHTNNKASAGRVRPVSAIDSLSL
ncbi:Lcl domain-containing protein, partial [Bacteroides faecis]|uniref:Lcl domain-containing protein n=1 Tax=Bacteroides faecis TaxID=674529 RepID=UPI0010208F7B